MNKNKGRSPISQHYKKPYVWLDIECSMCKMFGDKSKMVKRCSRSIGATPFYGCSNYPKCDFTMSTSTFGKYLAEKKRGYEHKRKPTI